MSRSPKEREHLRLITNAGLPGGGADLGVDFGEEAVLSGGFSVFQAAPRKDLNRLVYELSVLTDASGADVLEGPHVARVIGVMADQHGRQGFPLTCLMCGLATPGINRKLFGDDGVGDLAQFVLRSSRKTDRVARYAGDSVALFLSGEGIESGMNVARRLLSHWQAWLDRGGRPYNTGLMIGISTLREITRTGDELLRHAYLALQDSRSLGPGSISHYGESEAAQPSTFEPLSSPAQVFASFPRLSRYLGYQPVRAANEHLERLRQRYAGIDLENARRVAEGALELGRRIDLTADDQAMLAAAALVRDVGMAQVPSPILRQKGPLIAEHRRLIQDHPQQSTHAVKALALPEEAQKIILHHHERIDGQGYPSRLSGDDIPIGARVIAIVDAMEAMTSSRVYRHAALTREEARAELQRSAGSQFDPQLVEKFLDV